VLKTLNQNFFFIKIPSFLVILLPITLVTGPFLSDLSISIVSIFFIILSFKKDLSKYYNSFFFKLFIVFYILINISSVLGVNPYLSLKNSLFYFRHGLFALYFWYLLDNVNFLKKYLFYTFVVTFSFLVIDGFTQYFFGSNFFGWPIAGSGRISSFFGDELILGSYLSRLFPIIFCLLIMLHKSDLSSKSLIYIFFLFLATDVLIFLSGERVAFFLMNLSTIYIILLVKKFKYFRILTYLLAIASIILITVINPTAKIRIFDQTLTQMGVQSDKSKIFKQFKFIDPFLFSLPHEVLFSTGLNVFKNNKIFGVGPKNFRTECKNPKNYIMSYSCDTHPHNTYIQLLAETGIFAFTIIFSLFLWLMIETLKIIINYLKKKKNISDEIICLYSCFLMSLWPIIPSGSFFHNWMCIVYFFPIGFFLHLKNK
tara:strand:+ start:2854 stop:4134 length:1281 start_codon:yes stop_codon:yes gene_type:complete